MAERIPDHVFDRWMRSAQHFEEKWRVDNQKNFEYLDGCQWTDEELRKIESRGQQTTVINTILPTVDMVCAVASNQTADIQVVGRENSDEQMANLLTHLLKHALDTCHFDYKEKLAIRESYIGGRSWFEVGMYTDERGKDLIKINHIPWENVYLDPFSREPDASDARFIIKSKWVDRDVAKSLFRDAAEMLDSVFNDDYKGQEYEAQTYSSGRGELYWDSKSDRIRICECYYKRPEKVTIKVMDEETGEEREKKIIRDTLHYVIFSDEVILQGSATEHSINTPKLDINHYPLIPMFCRRDRNGRPCGVVKNLLDLQDQINKLNSKFIWTLSSNRLIMEEGAAQDVERIREEYQRPDGVVILNSGGLSKIRVDDKYRDLSYMSNHLNFLLATEQRISGVNDSMLGLGGTNERSGVMQSTRISQGASMQTSILENMFYARECVARVVLKLIGRYYTDYRVMQITEPNGSRVNYEFNAKQQVVDPATGEVQERILHKIENILYYDVILKRVPPFTTIKERQMQIFAEVLKTGTLPAEIAGKIMLGLSDLPNKEDLMLEMQNIVAEQQQMAQAQMQAQMMQSAGGDPNVSPA